MSGNQRELATTVGIIGMPKTVARQRLATTNENHRKRPAAKAGVAGSNTLLPVFGAVSAFDAAGLVVAGGSKTSLRMSWPVVRYRTRMSRSSMSTVILVPVRRLPR